MRPLLLILLAVAACGPRGGAMPQQKLTLRAKGLFLSQNPLSAVPEGGMSTADNVVISRDDVAQKRRGYAYAGGSAGAIASYARSLFGFSGEVLFVTDEDELHHFNGTDNVFSGSYGKPLGFRNRFVQASGSAYLTSDSGLYKLDDVTDTPVLAGAPRGIEGTASTTGGSGFLPNDSAVAYRVVWGSRDEDGVVTVGAPSGRIVIANPASTGHTVNVSLTVDIPSDVNATHFAQVFRSYASPTAADSPGDDLFQVYEYVPTAAELAAKAFTFTDIVPQELLGPAFYGSPNVGDGAASYKERPPLMTDVALFQGRLFGCNTRQPQNLQIRLLSVGSPSGVVAGDVLALEDDSFVDYYTADGSTTDSTHFKVETGGTAGQNIDATARNLVRSINKGTKYRARYLSSDTDSPGLLEVERASVADSNFFVRLYVGNPRAWAPALQLSAGTSVNVVTAARSGSAVTLTYAHAHFMVVGQQFNLVESDDPTHFPTGVKTVASVPTSTTLTYTEAGSALSGVNVLTESLDPLTYSTDDAAPNGISFSELEEYGAWPLANSLTAGSPDKRVLRVVALRDALYIFKEDGLFRLTGTGPADFSVALFDGTVVLAAPETAQPLANRIWAYTTQGVVAVAETGAEVVSRALDTVLQRRVATLADDVFASAFAVGYETEREYRLWLPVDSSGYAQEAYVLNVATRAWTRFDVAALAGFVNPADNKQWLSTGTGDKVFLQERKSFNENDYQDTTGYSGGVEVTAAIDSSVKWTVETMGAPGNLKRWVATTALLEDDSASQVTLNWETEYAGPEETSMPVKFRAASAFVPIDESRSARLTAGVEHAVKGEAFNVVGLAVSFVPGADRIGGR